MKRLNLEQKRFLVRSLAAFQTPSEAAASFAEQFGFEIARNHAIAFDPTTAAGANLGEELRTLFRETRKAWLAEVESDVPLASQKVRLLDMQRDLDELEAKKASIPPKAIGMLISLTKEKREIRTEAAKTVGGMFEKAKVEGEGGDTGAQAHFESALEKAYPDEAAPGE